jgi:hypothetical protein
MKPLFFIFEFVTLFIAICLISNWIRLNGDHQISFHGILNLDFLVGSSCLVSFLLANTIRKNIDND